MTNLLLCPRRDGNQGKGRWGQSGSCHFLISPSSAQIEPLNPAAISRPGQLSRRVPVRKKSCAQIRREYRDLFPSSGWNFVNHCCAPRPDWHLQWLRLHRAEPYRRNLVFTSFLTVVRIKQIPIPRLASTGRVVRGYCRFLGEFPFYWQFHWRSNLVPDSQPLSHKPCKVGGGCRNRTDDRSFADSRLTTWLTRPRLVHRKYHGPLCDATGKNCWRQRFGPLYCAVKCLKTSNGCQS